MQVFDDSDEVGANVVFLQSCQQNCMPLEIYEVMVDRLAGAGDVSHKGFLG